MLEQLESGLGLDIVIWLQVLGNPFLDLLAKALHLMGSNLFYLLVLPPLYWSIDRRLGRRILLILIAALIAVNGLKLVMQTPRPHLTYPDVVTAKIEQDGFGIPSGHVAMALVLWGYSVAWFKPAHGWRALTAYVILMGWSRMYNGVHYPQDVVAGLILGVLILALCLRYLDTAARFWREMRWPLQLTSVILLGLVTLLLMASDEYGQVAVGLIFGGGIGVMLEERYLRFSVAGDTRQRILRTGLGLLVLLLVFGGLHFLLHEAEPALLFRPLRYGLIALVGMAGWPWLSLRLGLTD